VRRISTSHTVHQILSRGRTDENGQAITRTVAGLLRKDEAFSDMMRRVQGLTTLVAAEEAMADR
jgi:hypothetical protein